MLLSIPFALVGSIWLLWLLDYRMSTAVWVGMIALVGLAAQTGIVMIVYIDQAFERHRGAGRIHDLDDIIAAHMEGTVLRVRPKLMTVSTMLIGLVPLLWAQSSGADVMQRIAAPMVGGLITLGVPDARADSGDRHLRAAGATALGATARDGAAAATLAGGVGGGSGWGTRVRAVAVRVARLRDVAGANVHGAAGRGRRGLPGRARDLPRAAATGVRAGLATHFPTRGCHPVPSPVRGGGLGRGQALRAAALADPSP